MEKLNQKQKTEDESEAGVMQQIVIDDDQS